jgi:hypothetical protein
MSTLRTTISLASTTLFPTPVSFTKIVNESVNGYHNGFQQITIGDGNTSTLYSSSTPAGNTGVVYFYAESLAANTTTINLLISVNGGDRTYFGRIIPGDVLYFPLWAMTSIEIFAENGEGAPAALSFFVGEKE